MMQVELPSLPEGFEYRLDLRHHVTPKLLKEEPIHRWFWFPHSFSPSLLDEFLKEFPLTEDSTILDPFVGAGTAVLRAHQLKYNAVGCDISPLSIFVTQTKLQHYDVEWVKSKINRFQNNYAGINVSLNNERFIELWENTERFRKAFTKKEWEKIADLNAWIQSLTESKPEKDLLTLAMLKTQQLISRAVPDGGWFRWIEKPDQSNNIYSIFFNELNSMLKEISYKNQNSEKNWQVFQADSRNLSGFEKDIDLIFTSPPYPNRHDYTRVFHLTLLGLGLTEKDILSLRHNSFRSHVEAKSPPIVKYNVLKMSPTLAECLSQFSSNKDQRIPKMIEGYFEDMLASLISFQKILKDSGLVVLVIGNVRHQGVMVPVDEIIIELGTSIGFNLVKAWVARLRGNSAQQMKLYGRQPSREAIVILRKI